MQAADQAGVWYSEMTADIQGITEAGKQSGLDEEIEITGDAGRKVKEKLWKVFAALEGGVFFDSVIRNPREFELDRDILGDTLKSKENPKKALESALDALQKALPEKRGLARESTLFYALLLMDGDGMGKLLQKYQTQ